MPIPSRRRWLRFWLWTTLIIIAVPAYVVVDSLFRINQRRSFLAHEAELAKSHGLVIQEGPEKTPLFFGLRLFGERGYSRIEVFVKANTLQELTKHPDFDKCQQVPILFPEADVTVERSLDDGHAISTSTIHH